MLSMFKNSPRRQQVTNHPLSIWAELQVGTKNLEALLKMLVSQSSFKVEGDALDLITKIPREYHEVKRTARLVLASPRLLGIRGSRAASDFYEAAWKRNLGDCVSPMTAPYIFLAFASGEITPSPNAIWFTSEHTLSRDTVNPPPFQNLDVFKIGFWGGKHHLYTVDNVEMYRTLGEDQTAVFELKS